MDTQKLLDRRLTRMADTADVAGWTAYAEAIRARVGRKPAKTWTKVFHDALADVYDPNDPQKDKAVRAAWIFASAFADDRYAGDEEALVAYLHTPAYWCQRHLAAQGVKGLKAKPAPQPKAAAKETPKAKAPARKKASSKAAKGAAKKAKA